MARQGERNVWTTWIWPIIKGILAIAVVAALVKIAFFGDNGPDPDTPTGEAFVSTVQPQKADIVNTVQFDGTIQRPTAVPSRIPLNGNIQEVFVKEGQMVEYGQVIASIKQETPREPVQNPDGSITERDPVVRWADFTADASGRITSLTVLPEQSVSIGEVGAQITPSSLMVRGDLAAAQLYRLKERPNQATVTIIDGPAPFTCTDLAIGESGQQQNAQNAQNANDNPAGAADPGVDGAGQSATQVSCRIPPQVEAYPGVKVKVSIEAGRAEGALTVPVTAVKGGSDEGKVVVVNEDGTERDQPVKLGLSDGERVQILEGISESDTIREFIAPPSTQRPEEGEESWEGY